MPSREAALTAYEQWRQHPVTVAVCAACRCPWMAHHTTGCVSCGTGCVHPEVILRDKGSALEAEALDEMVGTTDE